jgi:hypothetical protein
MGKFGPRHSKKDHWEKDIKNFKNQISDYDLIEIDKKRNINYDEKDTVWENSESHLSFDNDIFRKDILGNVCIRYIQYRKDVKSRVFACEYEHIIAHSAYGPSTIENVCLLNAGINRSKSNNNLYDTKFYEMKGWCSVYGISFSDLEFKLLNDLHATCLKYDLYFKKNPLGEWVVDRNENYNNQYFYSNNVPDKCGYFYSFEKVEIYCRMILENLGINDNNTIELILGIILAGSLCWIYIGEENRKRIRYNIRYIFTYITRKAKSYAESLVSNLKKISYSAYGHSLLNFAAIGLVYFTIPAIAIPYGCAMTAASAAIVYMDIEIYDKKNKQK